MRDYKLENDEVLINDYKVKYKGKENIQLVISNKNIIFYKEIKILKIYKEITKIAIKHIKVYKEKPQIKINKSTVTIQTTNGTIEFNCKSMLEARKIEKVIFDLRTDTNLIDRATKTANNTTKIIKGVIGLIVALKGVPSAIEELKKHKKEVLKIINILFRK